MSEPKIGDLMIDNYNTYKLTKKDSYGRFNWVIIKAKNPLDIGKMGFTSPDLVKFFWEEYGNPNKKNGLFHIMFNRINFHLCPNIRIIVPVIVSQSRRPLI